jgi:hypothetical protein
LIQVNAHHKDRVDNQPRFVVYRQLLKMEVHHDGQTRRVLQ